MRTTVSEMGPTLLNRMLELNDVQSGVLDIAFKLADDQGLLLLDLDDLRALLTLRAENKAEDLAELRPGQPAVGRRRSSARCCAWSRTAASMFFGEPALELADLMRQDMSGRGIINVLTADQLILKPRLYSSFLLWLLSELFENLPEVGDLDQPKLVFFFDEAHLLFDDCPPALQQRIEQVVRLIRSKGVGVYFCSQNPDDVPDVILGQLGNRIQHALRAYTPRDQKAVRTAAETFVPNPKLDVAQVISELGVGEALVSTLQDKGIPMPVERALICPPRCAHGRDHAGGARRRCARAARVGGKYDTAVNRESAYEMLARRAAEKAASAPATGKPRAARRGKTPARPSRAGRAQQARRIPVGHQAPPGRGRGRGEVGHAHASPPASAGRSCAACSAASSAARSARQPHVALAPAAGRVHRDHHPRRASSACAPNSTTLWRVRRPEVVRRCRRPPPKATAPRTPNTIYRKKQLGEIDRRVRYLSKRLEALKVVEQRPSDTGAIYFGAWLELENADSRRSARATASSGPTKPMPALG